MAKATNCAPRAARSPQQPFMADLTLDRLRRDGQKFMEELSREYYLAHSGVKQTAELAPIYARHREVVGTPGLEVALDAFKSSTGDSLRSARALLEWQVESQAGRAVAAQEEAEIAWESQATIRLSDGSQVPYSSVAIQIANTTNRAERETIDEARASLVEKELAPLKQERLHRERDFVESLDIASGYIGTFEALSGVSIDALAGQCTQFLRDTQSMWDDVFRETVRKSLGIDPGMATRADAQAVMRAPQFDEFFPARAMEDSVRRQVTQMGIDPSANGRVIYDLGDRPGKRSRAFCAPVRVPEEVYLVLRPHGGQSDWSTLLHELGHALHFAFMRPDLEFEFRWAGDNSVTEGYAMLFDHLMHNEGWLSRYTGLRGEDARRFQRSTGFEELQFLRRYCGKLLYEAQLYGGTVSWGAMPDLYVETLSSATNFAYRRADAFIDVDPRFYSARYLRAWQLQALLTETLREQFDEDWYRNPNTGPWMTTELFGEGQRELAGELAERVSGKSLDFGPLVRGVEQLLG